MKSIVKICKNLWSKFISLAGEAVKHFGRIVDVSNSVYHPSCVVSSEKNHLMLLSVLQKTLIFQAYLQHGGNHWLADPSHPHYIAGRKANHIVYGTEPELTREGGSIPITLTFQQLTGKSVMLLPMGAADDGAHSQNEKIDVRNYIQGVSVLS